MFRDLYAHMEWADAIVWRAVMSSEAAANDKRVCDLLLHLHMTQRAFLMIWRGDAMLFPERESFRNAADIEKYGRAVHEEIWPWLAKLDDNAIAAEMNMPWATRYRPDAGATTMRDTMLQVLMHSTYHRGQVNARLRELGVDPPLTDYIAWAWQHRPAPVW